MQYRRLVEYRGHELYNVEHDQAQIIIHPASTHGTFDCTNPNQSGKA
jgi:hypothetical protein